MLAGQEEDGRLWLAAIHPLTDLFRDPSRSQHISSAFMDFVYDTPFVEVYTDTQERSGTGYHPGCCVVDFFTYWDEPILEHRVITLKVTNRIAAEWGAMADTPERERRWLSVSLDRFLQPHDMEPLSLYRFTVENEEGWAGGGQGWVNQATSVLVFALRAFFRTARTEHAAPLIQTVSGDIVFEGKFPYEDVANYFLHLARR